MSTSQTRSSSELKRPFEQDVGAVVEDHSIVISNSQDVLDMARLGKKQVCEAHAGIRPHSLELLTRVSYVGVQKKFFFSDTRPWVHQYLHVSLRSSFGLDHH